MRLGLSAWRHGLAQPFYVPKELQHVRVMLADGRVSEATRELWRLATMGSSPAAATLGYMCLACGELSGVDCLAALELCRHSANRNCGFAQYVVAWKEYELGNYRELRRWLHRSADQRFGPAICDLGRLAVTGKHHYQRRPEMAKKYFRFAVREGHIFSVIFFLQYCRERKFGVLLQLFSTVALPISRAFIVPASWFYPFGIAVFSYPASRKRPLFAQAN